MCTLNSGTRGRSLKAEDQKKISGNPLYGICNKKNANLDSKTQVPVVKLRNYGDWNWLHLSCNELTLTSVDASLQGAHVNSEVLFKLYL